MHFFRARVCGLMIAVVVAATSGAAQTATNYVEGEVIVTFKSSMSLASARRNLTGRSLSMPKYYALLSARRHRPTAMVRRKGRTTAELIAELKQDPAVETAEPNYLRRIATQSPNDTLFPMLWGLDNTGQTVSGTAGTVGDDIEFLGAWSLARPSASNTVVAVIDTGMDCGHPDLVSNVWINPGENPTNGIDDDYNGYTDDYHGYDFADGMPDPADSGYHGTHVSGTIGATGYNQTGVIGVDYQARIMALKASNNGTNLPDSAIIEAIQYAILMKERGINIVAINASFGGPGYDTAMRDAIQAAGDAGIVFCAAAGNYSSDNDYTSFYPASYRLTNMIVVAATDANDNLASFSNYGASTVDLGAPGVNILSTLPTNLVETTAYVQQGSTVYSAYEMTYSGRTTGLTATIYDCGLGYPTNFPIAVSNNIALIARGTLTFSDKVTNAMAAGARAAVIYNNVSGNFYGTLQVSNNWIPTVSLSQVDGLALEAVQPATGTVANYINPTNAYAYLDGTSMATPHVTGAVAFAALNFPAETVSQRIQRILTNADLVPGLTGYVITGSRLNLRRMVDTDGNGLPDWWEQLYFGQLTGSDPNGDPDHDGSSTEDEWLAGTNPTNAASCLRLIALGFDNTNHFVVRWPSVAGKIYRLERATDLLTGFNAMVQTNIAATPPTNTAADPSLPTGDNRFYRIQLE